MLGKLDQTLRFHEQALSLRAQRQEQLASNIANADTPGYKAKDIDFNSALKSALEGRDQGSVLRLTSPRHLLPASSASLPSQVVYRTSLQASVDGNTVDLDVERAQFVNNAVHYEANLTFMTMQIRQLLAAMQG